MPAKLSVRDLDVRDKTVFCRVDFNVPLDGARVTDDRRIAASLPTLELLAGRGARVVLASHLGRPKGKRNDAMSLRPVATRLAELTSRDVRFADECVGPQAECAVAATPSGGFVLLENLRFHPEEEANEAGFATALATLAQVYVNDAFGTAHRAHASTVGVPRILKPAAAGLLMDAELTLLGGLLGRPERPFLAILGGAKVSDKIELIDNLIPRVDAFLIGGAMAYTFLAAEGVAVGDSRVEADKIELARELGGKISAAGRELLLPVDHVVAVGGDDARHRVTDGAAIATGEAGCDIGPRTVEAFSRAVRGARTVLWNGPLGRFELDAYASGTRAVGEALAASGATSIVGGGDTASAVAKFGIARRMTHVSTGGGASLEFLSGLNLPGVEALSDAP